MAKIIVIKIGSSILLNQNGELNQAFLLHLIDQIITLQRKGYEAILVISGAVACGLSYFDYSTNRSNTVKQIAAGIGQAQLIAAFDTVFKTKNLQIALMLLTRNDLKQTLGRQMIKQVLLYYAELQIIPIINENDVVELNSFGGNDILAGEIALLMKADELIILSSYQPSRFGVGGAKTKTEVVTRLNNRNIHSVIVDGKSNNSIINHSHL